MPPAQMTVALRNVSVRKRLPNVVSRRSACRPKSPVFFGLILAVGSALGVNASFLLKARGAAAAPPVRARHPLQSAIGLFRSRWFAVGWIVAVGAWLLHVAALALAPLSITQAVLSGGLVFLAVLAERFFGFRLRRRQWVGVAITAIGLAVIGLTGTGSRHPGHSSLGALISVECSILAIGMGLVGLSSHRHVKDRPEALLLGIAAGALFGVSDVAIKYLTGAHQPLFGLLSPWTLSALVAAVVSFYASARSLQLGQAVEVIALTSVAANLAAIIGGILVFRESIGAGALAITGRSLAFGLVIAGAAMMPAPLRVTSQPPGLLSDDLDHPGERSEVPEPPVADNDGSE
jgi:drug/metabolite transporter (DMT)-like permease